MQYSKPPITEAVIEFRFAGDCPQAARKKISRRLSKTYPIEEVQRRLTVKASLVGIEGVQQSVTEVGLKRWSHDRTEVATLSDENRNAESPAQDAQPAAFSASQLAPYCGWESFCNRFLEGWSEVEKVIGHRKLLRIGVRFINRIDIRGAIEEPKRWVLIGPVLPRRLPKPAAFTLHTVLPLELGQANVVAATTASPLPHHSAIVLDIDIYTTAAISDRHADRLEILKEFRTRKNDIFESCITDETRGLFG